jgi:hypothetical protein
METDARPVLLLRGGAKNQLSKQQMSFEEISTLRKEKSELLTIVESLRNYISKKLSDSHYHPDDDVLRQSVSDLEMDQLLRESQRVNKELITNNGIYFILKVAAKLAEIDVLQLKIAELKQANEDKAFIISDFEKENANLNDRIVATSNFCKEKGSLSIIL